MPQSTSFQPAMQPLAYDVLNQLAHAGLSDETLGRALRDLLNQPERWSAKAPVEVQAPAPTRKATPARKRDLVAIKTSVGDAMTSVSVSQSLLATLAERLGSMKVARKRVRALAKEAPVGAINRSGWVQDQIVDFLAKPKESAANPAAAPIAQVDNTEPATPPLTEPVMTGPAARSPLPAKPGVVSSTSQGSLPL